MGRKIVFFLFMMSLMLAPAGILHAQEEGRYVSGRFCSVFYEEGVSLREVNRRVNLRFSDFYSPRAYREKADLPMDHILSEKFDAIFARVEDILDMYPSKVRVNIMIYKDRKGLDAAYEEIFNEPNTAVSFYVYKTNTIYTTVKAMTEGILAHEMAHCIIDHYFVILPPRKIQEMLAVYADIHLKN
ncbi:MAG: hypothetical protein KKH08_04035 [Candidatus Omnitrophica bacterium]|nr:hypothetical protein [Candidatus Omnitrophota bacterium]